MKKLCKKGQYIIFIFWQYLIHEVINFPVGWRYFRVKRICFLPMKFPAEYLPRRSFPLLKFPSFIKRKEMIFCVCFPSGYRLFEPFRMEQSNSVFIFIYWFGEWIITKKHTPILNWSNGSANKMLGIFLVSR